MKEKNCVVTFNGKKYLIPYFTSPKSPTVPALKENPQLLPCPVALVIAMLIVAIAFIGYKMYS